MTSNERLYGSTPADIAKLALAVALVLGSIAAFYMLPQISWAVRTVAVIAALGAALFITAFTGLGMRARGFIAESQFELRKIVWPTRQETLQTTLVILVVVIIAAILLWLVDMFFGWAILQNLLKPGS